MMLFKLKKMLEANISEAGALKNLLNGALHHGNVRPVRGRASAGSAARAL